MAIRNIAHSIRAGEISLGVAVGVESMSVKSVLVALQFDSPSVLIFLVLRSPRPTPVVVDTVGANPQAHDCIQVRSLEVGALRVVILYDDCSPWDGPQKWSPKRTISLGRSKTSTRSFHIHALQRFPSLSRFVFYFCSPLSETLTKMLCRR
jgi:hypothetical protein